MVSGAIVILARAATSFRGAQAASLQFLAACQKRPQSFAG